MREENHLLKLDNEWNEAYPRRDLSALDRIIADDWVCIDGAGLVISKKQLLDRVESSTAFLDPHKFDQIALRMFGDTAIVTGRLSGTRRDNDGAFYLEQRYTRVYVKRNDRWQSVATQVTVVKEEKVRNDETPNNPSEAIDLNAG
jgi:ketosteroid isomerase-like protein